MRRETGKGLALKVVIQIVRVSEIIVIPSSLEALKSGNSYVEEMVAEYDRRRKLLVAGLNRLGLSTFEPRGAFYAFPNITASGMDDEAFAEKLLREEGVAVVPGNAFGPGGDGFVRACYATAYEKIEEALQRMERELQSAYLEPAATTPGLPQQPSRHRPAPTGARQPGKPVIPRTTEPGSADAANHLGQAPA